MNNLGWTGLFIVPVITVAFIWMPFGFELGGLIEEWDILDLFTKHGLFFFTSPSSPLPQHSLRPLTIFPHAISYWLDPDSFFYWHILMVFAISLKGISLAIIGSKISKSIPWGILLGVIGIIHPADTMQLCFRSFHINLALGLFLLSGSLVLLSYELKIPSLQKTIGIISGLVFLISVMMYEAGIMMVFFPFLMFYLVQGTWKGFSKSHLPQTSWLIGAFLYVGYAVIISGFIKSSYQGNLAQSGDFLTFFFKGIPKVLGVTLPRALVGGWLDAVKISVLEFHYPIYMILFVLIVGGCFFLLLRKENGSPGPLKYEPSSNSSKIIIVGIILVLAGYLPFMVSNNFWNTSQRTYLFASPGATLCTIGCLIWLNKRSNWLMGIVVCGLLYTGFCAQLNQFNHYLKISNRQKTLIRNIVENCEGNSANQSIIILDESNQLSNLWLLREHLAKALNYFYRQNSISTQIVTVPGMEWQKLNNHFCTGICFLEKDHFRFREAPIPGESELLDNKKQDLIISKKAAIVINILKDGSILNKSSTNHYRFQLKSLDNHQGKRYREILSNRSYHSPLASFGIFPSNEPTNRMKWDFGRWWSMDSPVIGSGWNEPIWKFLFHKTVIWKNQPVSRLLFEINPAKSPYWVQGKFNDIPSEETKNSIQIRINNQLIPFSHLKSGYFEGKICADSLLKGSNLIEFYSKMNPENPGLAFSLDWLEIAP